MSTARVTPATVVQLPTETLPWRFDADPLLDDGEAPSSASATLVEVASRQPYAAGLSGSPSVTSNRYITQTVTALQPGRDYRLVVTFQAAAGKIWSMPLLMRCEAD